MHFIHFPRFLSIIFLLALALAVALPAQETPTGPSRQDQIRQRGTVVIGLQRGFVPFHIANAKEGYPGIDVEIGEALAKALGVRPQFVFKNLSGLLSATASGQVDVALGGISSDLDRARSVRFARPYLVTSPAGLLDRRRLPAESGSVDFPKRRIQGLADLRYLGKVTIGVRKGTSNRRLLAEDPFFKKHSVVEFATRAELSEALRRKRIDLWLADRAFFKALILQKPALLAGNVFLSDDYREEHLSPAVSPGDANFLLYVDFFIKELKRTGTLERLRQKYFESNDWIK